MSFDKYSDKAAEAQALIREFSPGKVEYWDYFKGDPEQALEAFCAMQDAAEEMGRMNERQACSARIEELERELRNKKFAESLKEEDEVFFSSLRAAPVTTASTTKEKNNG